MKSHSVDRIPAVARLDEYIRTNKGLPPIVIRDIKYVLEGVEKLDQEVKLKATQIATINQQKDGVINNLQQTITSKTSEVQSKNSLLAQKEQLLIQKEQLLTELRIREENQLKEEYISVLHQLNPKVYSANYEDWSGKAQGAKNLIDQGNLTKIKKNLPVYKQQLAQKIETEKLALVTKEAEKLDKAKEEAVSLLHQLHPHAYPVNYEDWPTHIKARKLLDSGNLQAIEKNLVIYRELLKKELARQKEEVQSKDQLILQKEQDLKSLNDTFTTTISTKEEELKSLHDTLLAKNTAISEVSHKVKKKNKKLAQEIQSKNQLALQKAMEEEIRIQKEQEIERLRELLAQNEIQTQELLARQELEKQELLIQKENELRKKDELLLVKESEVHNKSAEKNRIIEELASNLLTKEEEIVSKNLKIGEVSHKAKKVGRKLAAKDNLLSDKEQKIEELKALIEQTRIEKEELLAKQELALANKSHIKNRIIDELEEEINLQEDEVVNLRLQNLEKELMTQEQEKLLIQKDIELENLFDQKDEAVRNKSLVKNQIIGGLREAMNEKEKEALYSQIELLKKQLEFKDKEAEDARIISELKDQLLTLKALYGHDVSFAEEFSAIQFRAENSIANNDFGDIADLSRYISRLVEAERDNSVSADFSNLLANISLINHGEEQPIYRSIYIEDRSVQPGESLAERQMESLDLSSMMNQDRQNQVVQTGVSIIAGEQMSVPLNQGNIMNHGAQNQNLIGNFDIDNQHITHSVALGGEGSESFSIIDAENSH